jgi:hypothetical protein
MKKTYINPTLTVVKIQTAQMLALSNPNASDTEYSGTQYGREAEFSDWEMDE